MPLYTYRCSKKDCQHEFEVSHGIKQKPLLKCPECAKLSLERIIQVPLLGKVSRSPTEMKTVYDLARLNTDKLTKGEKEKKDHEYAEGSKLAKDKLKKQSMEKPWYHGPNEPKDLSQRLAKATDKQKQDYVQKGVIP